MEGRLLWFTFLIMHRTILSVLDDSIYIKAPRNSYQKPWKLAGKSSNHDELLQSCLQKYVYGIMIASVAEN